MKPIARINGNTVTFHSRLVPGISSIFAYVNHPQDVVIEYNRFIERERYYLENGPKAICDEYDFEFLYGKLKKKFVVNVSVFGLEQNGRRTYSRPAKRKELETNKNTAYRVVVRMKPGALKRIKAKIKAERDAKILDYNKKMVVNIVNDNQLQLKQ